MNRYFESLEIDKVLDKIRSYIHTSSGLKLLNKSKFISNYFEFTKENRLLDEYISLSNRYGNFNIQNLEDFYDELSIVSKGGIGTEEFFKKIYKLLEISSELISYRKEFAGPYDSLKVVLNDLTDLNALKNKIDIVFDFEFNIKDSASSSLKEIRRNISKINTSIKNTIVSEVKKNKDYLNDQSYSLRNGCYVLPVKTSNKNKIKGLVLDVSDSLETTFIEPESCLLLNNELQALKVAEKDEIKKILKNLSEYVGDYKEEILKNDEIIAKIDVLNAKYLYSRDINGVVIQTFNDSSFNLKNARHPLIDPNLIVSNSIKMDNLEKQLIISGPNAGGKSVFLKMIGLLVLMNQLIIPLPVEEDSTIGFFHHIYLDIGDVQSIEENLSTFSGHISNVTNILNRVTSNDLVLIDELGTGTDPKEGEALAVSISKYLRDVGCKSFITSHFDGVKKYAISSDDVLCASMLFNEETLSPLYKLEVGLPGKSYGIFIAKKYGINSKIIQDSQGFLKNNKLKGEADYVKILTDKINEYNEKIDQEKVAYERLKKNEVEYKNKIKILEEKLKNFSLEMNNEKEEIINETREKIKNLKKIILEKGSIKLNDVIDAEKWLDDLIDNKINYNVEEKQVNEIHEEILSIGDYVRNETLDIEGKIVSIGKKGVTIISSDELTYTLNPTSLIKIEKVKEKKKKSEENYYDAMVTNLPFELNLLGKRVDEAINELDYYIDRAILAHRKSFKVIHGYGTGALRKAVWEYLKTNKQVKSFNYGGEFDGGMGSTNVELK